MTVVTEKQLAESVDEVAQVTAKAITYEIQQSEERLKEYMHEHFASKEQMNRVLQIVESIDRKLSAKA